MEDGYLLWKCCDIVVKVVVDRTIVEDEYKHKLFENLYSLTARDTCIYSKFVKLNECSIRNSRFLQ